MVFTAKEKISEDKASYEDKLTRNIPVLSSRELEGGPRHAGKKQLERHGREPRRDNGYGMEVRFLSAEDGIYKYKASLYRIISDKKGSFLWYISYQDDPEGYETALRNDIGVKAFEPV